MSDRELNEKLAKWVGFVGIRWQGHYWLGYMVEPTNSPIELLNFTQSLDACFKWLVPKVIRDAEYSVIITQNLAQSIGYIRPLQSGKQYDAVDNHSPALALCLAIEKLIDSEVKDDSNNN